MAMLSSYIPDSTGGDAEMSTALIIEDDPDQAALVSQLV